MADAPDALARMTQLAEELQAEIKRLHRLPSDRAPSPTSLAAARQLVQVHLDQEVGVTMPDGEVFSFDYLQEPDEARAEAERLIVGIALALDAHWDRLLDG